MLKHKVKNVIYLCLAICRVCLCACVSVSLRVCACRRNLPGDRQKALDIMLPLVEAEEQVASDIYCLVGRIYKDTFLESHFADTASRDSGTLW